MVKVSSPYSGGFALAPDAGQTIEGINIWMGSTWFQRDGVRAWRAIASSADGTRLVAVVSNGQICTLPAVPLTGPQHSSAELVDAGSGRWIVVNQQGPLTPPWW